MFLRIVAAAALFFVAACAEQNIISAQQTDLQRVNGTILSIEPDTRRFDLRTQGRILTLRANDEVRNFDQLSEGDRITLSYYRSAALSMALPEDETTPVGAVFEARAPEGALPGAVEAEALALVLEFRSYDQRSKTVVLRGAEGEDIVAHVPRDLRGFLRARMPGDRINVALSRAIAVSVEPA